MFEHDATVNFGSGRPQNDAWNSTFGLGTPHANAGFDDYRFKGQTFANFGAGKNAKQGRLESTISTEWLNASGSGERREYKQSFW